MTTATQRAKEHSRTKLSALRARLADMVPPSDVVVTCGSYARQEASAESDIDFFVITDGPLDAEKVPWLEPVEITINQIVPIQPAEDGAFSTLESRDAMLHNIGGQNDSNHKITRRMLLLLEGNSLFNHAGLRAFRRQILERYIGEGMTDHQLALFLLNDIIRYYRTMAVDYEFKAFEGDNPKPWGIRNIKLVFSRKLLYASGLFSVALTLDRAREAKVEKLESLFDLPVIDRMKEVCGATAMEGVLGSYDYFLEKLESAEVRERLKSLQRDERHDPLFRELKNEGHHFNRELLSLYEKTFDATHPIRRAVIF